LLPMLPGSRSRQERVSIQPDMETATTGQPMAMRVVIDDTGIKDVYTYI